MSNFEVEYIDLNLGDLENTDVDFYPVIYVNDSNRGEIGAIALSGRVRTFPLTSLYSYNACQLSEKEFFNRFPDLRIYFTSAEKQAA